MQLVSREKSGHWYSHCSETGIIMPCYEVPRSDGKGMRSTTLADARKQQLLIGISSVVGVLPKPALESWKQEQAILAALTLPRLPDEPMDVFAKRCCEDMGKQSSDARDFGSQIHQGIEDYLNGMEIRTPSHIKDYLSGFYDFASKNIEEVHGTEQVVGDPALGIAGRLDADVTLKGVGRTVIDAKTQRLKNGTPTFYNEWNVQLSAYEHCRRREDNTQRELVSIVINSAKPDEPHVKHWLGSRELGWKMFQHCLEIWMFTNSFNPSHH